jgi:ribonuclease HI
MKQLDLFSTSGLDKIKKSSENKWELYIDGASRNNPGPAGAGIYIIKNDKPFVREGFFLGSKTNNQAEYSALLIGLLILREHMQPSDVITIISDSELLVLQIQGRYKVRQPELQRLHALAMLFLQDIDYTIRHVLRAQNAVADELANLGIDKKIELPERFVQKLGL